MSERACSAEMIDDSCTRGLVATETHDGCCGSRLQRPRSSILLNIHGQHLCLIPEFVPTTSCLWRGRQAMMRGHAQCLRCRAGFLQYVTSWAFDGVSLRRTIFAAHVIGDPAMMPQAAGTGPAWH